MEQQNNAYEHEINIFDLWKVIIKRKQVIVGAVVFFVAVAAIVSFSMPKVYRGEAVLIMQPAANVSAKDLVEFVGNIDVEKRGFLLPKTASSILDIKLYVLRDSKDKIQVIIETKDVNAIPPALTELIDYANTIALVNSNVKEQQEKLLKQSTELSSVIASSADLLKTYDHLLKSGKLVPVGFNPVELNKRISDIKLEKFQVELAIQRLKGGVEIARQLYIENSPVRPSKRKNISLGGLIGIFIGIIVAFILEYNKNNRSE